ncbi:ABC transporter permease [Blautia sp. Marseille-P3201T]|uniref:ABC transporter permease n=1 Tax=Blautia sp. Marseille-P3201T TaxID=1907659 RepID=UPI00135643D8|nr:ABC transporter permease [Blautia sp. Marseille-P3201T]
MQTFKSLIYWIYVICVLLFFFTQMGSPEFDAKKPVKTENGVYGTVFSKDEKDIQEVLLGELAQDFYENSWRTYPAGFIKYVKLDEKETQEIDNILEEMTGLTEEQRRMSIEKFEEEISQPYMSPDFRLPVKEGVSYETFKENMKKVCVILGAGSSYEEGKFSQGVEVPADYEDAVAEYENLIEKDKFTGGYARLFSDYLGIVLGIMPVFVAVTRCMRDRRAKMQELIYVRKVSSGTVILSRYIAMVVTMLLPVIFAALYTLMQCIGYTKGMDIAIDYLAFVPSVFVWLLPEIMVVSALGMFLTELTDTAIAVLVQAVWWYTGVFMQGDVLTSGDFGFHLVIRHNSVLDYQVFADHYQEFIINRAFYAGVALFFVVLSVWVYSMKRKGAWDFYGKILRGSKRKSKA